MESRLQLVAASRARLFYVTQLLNRELLTIAPREVLPPLLALNVLTLSFRDSVTRGRTSLLRPNS